MSVKYKYKPGDVVVIRNDLTKNIRYEMVSGPRKLEAGCYPFSAQVDMKGKVVHIYGCERGKYIIEEDHGLNYWTDEMFEDITDCICSSLL